MRSSDIQFVHNSQLERQDRPTYPRMSFCELYSIYITRAYANEPTTVN